MNFRKLKIFYETAKYLNMTKVAKEMYISQPSISQSINELELELEVKLFDRIGKKLYLTHEGEAFLNYTRRILNLYDESVKTIRDINLNEKGKLTNDDYNRTYKINEKFKLLNNEIGKYLSKLEF
mgnify:CR=1 FL=1